MQAYISGSIVGIFSKLYSMRRQNKYRYNLLSETFKKNSLWGQMCTFGPIVAKNCASLYLRTHYNSEGGKYANRAKNMKLGKVVSFKILIQNFEGATIIKSRIMRRYHQLMLL